MRGLPLYHMSYLLLPELFVATPHLVLHVLKPNFQQEALEVSVVTVRRPHDMACAPRVPARQIVDRWYHERIKVDGA